MHTSPSKSRITALAETFRFEKAEEQDVYNYVNVSQENYPTRLGSFSEAMNARWLGDLSVRPKRTVQSSGARRLAQRFSDREADPLPLDIDTVCVFPCTTTWMLPLVLYWALKNVPA
jgi:hypothetical protein